MNLLSSLLTKVTYAAVIVDEAEGVIGVVSDWLELDSLDEWVRHDAEIVCTHTLISLIPSPTHQT